MSLVLSEEVAMLDILQTATDALFTLLRTFLLAGFAADFSFSDERAAKRTALLKNGRLNGALFVISRAAAVFAISELWRIYGVNDMERLAKLLVIDLVTLVLTEIFYRMDVTHLVFTVVFYSALSDISMFLANELLHLLSGQIKTFSALFETGRIDADTFLVVIERYSAAITAVFYLVHFILLYLSLRYIRRFSSDLSGPIERAELAFLLSPALAGRFICLTFRTVLLSMDGENLYSIYDLHPLVNVLIPVVCFLALSAMMIDIRVFSDNRRAAEKRSEQVILAGQIKAMQEELAAADRRDAALRSLRHDWKNHLSVLEAMQRTGRAAELNTYIKELADKIDETAPVFNTGNAVADTLLSVKKEAALADDTELDFDAEAFTIPSDTRIDGADLGIILSNALDNAIEACQALRDKDPQRERFIRLSSEPRDNMLFLKIVNSSAEDAVGALSDGLPVSSKSDRALHGIGMSNIRRVVRRCHGGMEFGSSDGEFTLLIMLQRGVS